jgi:hypothetical protein
MNCARLRCTWRPKADSRQAVGTSTGRWTSWGWSSGAKCQTAARVKNGDGTWWGKLRPAGRTARYARCLGQHERQWDDLQHAEHRPEREPHPRGRRPNRSVACPVFVAGTPGSGPASWSGSLGAVAPAHLLPWIRATGHRGHWMAPQRPDDPARPGLHLGDERPAGEERAIGAAGRPTARSFAGSWHMRPPGRAGGCAAYLGSPGVSSWKGTDGMAGSSAPGSA